jgi:hypothetical protein
MRIRKSRLRREMDKIMVIRTAMREQREGYSLLADELCTATLALLNCRFVPEPISDAHRQAVRAAMARVQSVYPGEALGSYHILLSKAGTCLRYY